MEAPKTSGLPSRASSRLFFILLLFLLPAWLATFAVLLIMTGWAKGNHSLVVGSTLVKVRTGLADADGMQAIISPSGNRFTLVAESEAQPGLGQENILRQIAQWVIQPQAAENAWLSKKNRVVRVRLGDVVYGGLYSQEGKIPVYLAAIRDERFDLIEKSAPINSALPNTGQDRGAKQTSVGSQDAMAGAQSPDDSLAARKLDKRFQQLRRVALINSSGPKDNPKALSDAFGGAGKSAQRTSTGIIASALTVGLLQCEQQGLRQVAFQLPDSADGLAPEKSLEASINTIKGLRNHLRAVERVWLLLPNITTAEDGSEALVEKVLSQARPQGWTFDWRQTLAQWLLVPEPFPAGRAFLSPQLIALFEIGPVATLTPGMFNTAGLARPRSTFWPSAWYVLLTLAALILAWRKEWNTKISVWRLMAGGTISWLGLAAMLVVLNHFWKWWPDTWISSAPVLSGFGLAVSILNFYWVRWFVQPPEQVLPGEVHKDNVLQSVLHCDCPAESIAADRLGFSPLVDALRRFLDNRNTKPPMVMSVNGPWGSGKSSLMKMLSHELEKTGRFTTVWFNAWQYHKEEQILAAFLKTIAMQLSKNWGMGFRLRMAWVRLRRCSYGQFCLFLLPLGMIGLWWINPHWLQFLLGGKQQWLIPGTTLTLAAVLAWAQRWVFKPFRLQFGKLYAVQDQSQRIGFIDEFTQEFKLFREVVGDRKFLIAIDDLDRCPPDKVVEVLKTINIIVTSGDGAGKSFFLLGYDRKYILQNIAANFREISRGGYSGLNMGFGAEYLKKMVNVSVSIPLATSEGVQNLAAAIDKEVKPRLRPRMKTSVWMQLGKILNTLPAWGKRLAGAGLTLVLLLALAAVVMRQPSAPKTNLEDTVAPSQELASADRLAVAVPDLKAPQAAGQPLWLWLLAGLILAAWGGFVAQGRLRKYAEPEVIYAREEQDTEKFLAAIRQCKDLLPKNPRDLVCLINRMRMEYLIQAEETWKAFSQCSPFSGPALQEGDCVLLSLLQQRHPEIFSPETGQDIIKKLKAKGVSQLLMESYVSSRNAEQSGEQDGQAHNLRALGDDLEKIKQPGADISKLFNQEKLQRYLEMNRFILD